MSRKRKDGGKTPTQADLKELLEYDEKSGDFIWKKKRGSSTEIGSLAGTTNNLGYRRISVFGKAYAAHRLAWLYVYVGPRGHNKSGYLGVSQHESGSWVAKIRVNGKNKSLGAFAKKEDAAAAYLKAKTELHVFQPTPRTSTGEDA